MNVVNTYNPIKKFVDTFEREVEMVAEAMTTKPRVKHIHFGGGSPTVLSPEDFKRVMDILKTHFNLDEVDEFAIEMDPRTLDKEKVQAYADEGVNRASLGIQDFNKDVQEAINRIQPFDMIIDAMEMLDAVGINKVNMDLIYGLPLQSIHSVTTTVKMAIALKPDRVSLFSYAHVPWMKKHQQMIDESTLPDLNTRLSMHTIMAEAFEKASYVAIGMDHFALPNDPLSKASKDGSLHRNFQGYTVDKSDALIGFGPSAISRFPEGFTQNMPDIKPWRDSINDGILPIQKGLTFTNEDHIFGTIIERIMCDFEVDLDAVAKQFGVSINFFSDSLTKLAPLVGAGVVSIKDHTLIIDSNYRMVVRTVASCFDQYLDGGEGKFSKVS